MTQTNTIQAAVTIEKGASVLVQLMAATELSENKLIDAAHKGAIWHKKPRGKKIKRIRKIGHRAALGLGHTLYVNYNSDVLSEQPMTPRLISDQVNYSIWHKPKGMWSQGSKWGDHCSITQAVKKIHGKPGLLVHRLDKATSGLMLIAHTKEAARRLSALFAEHRIEKHYRASVHGQFDKTAAITLDEALDDKPALTVIETSDYDESSNTSKLSLNIQTGRKHQIRRHLSLAGFPVVGDRLYGHADENSPDLQLEANRLAFTCPFTDKPLMFELD